MTSPAKSRRAIEIEEGFRSEPKHDAFDLEQIRADLKDLHEVTGVPEGVTFEHEEIAGVACVRARPAAARPDREGIYLHGGAYCLLSAMSHHRLGGHLANAIGADVLLPDYSLAPEAPYPAAIDQCAEVVADRLASGARRVFLMGDSAGGGLTLAVACRLRDQSLPLPTALGLLCPWLDLSLSGEDERTGRIDDPILAVRDLDAFAELYLAGRSATDPGPSPLFADLKDLPPALVQYCEIDLIRSDAVRVIRKWPEGSPIEQQYFPGMLHSFHIFAGDMPEADEAVAMIGDYARAQFAAAEAP